MAIRYPGVAPIPAAINPLEAGLAGLMSGFQAARKDVQKTRTLETLQELGQSNGVFGGGAPAGGFPSLASLGGAVSGGGVASSAGAAAGQTVGGSTPSTKLAGDSSKIYGDFIGTVKAGDPSLGLAGVTNPYGLAAVASTGKAESGYSPGNIHRQWSDPSESGKAGTAGGVMSWRAERLQNMRSFASKVGDNPNAPSAATQAKFFLSEDPSLVAKLNSARSPEEAQQLMNRAWAFAGYDRPGGEAGRRIAMARSYAAEFGRGGGAQQAIETIAPQAAAPQAAAPIQVASNDPQAGMASALAYSPKGPSLQAGIPSGHAAMPRLPNPPGHVPTPTARPGQTAPIPTPRPEDQTYTMASATAPGDAAPVQMAQAAQAGGDLTGLIQSVGIGQTTGPTLTRDQFAALYQSDDTRPLAMALFQSKLTGDPSARARAVELALKLDERNYSRSRDTLEDRRWQMEFDQKNTIKPTDDIQEYEFARQNGFSGSFPDWIKAGGTKGAGPKTSLSPLYGTDAQGNPVLLQPRDDGTAVQTQIPAGVTISTGVDKVDAGTHWVLQDKRSGQTIGTIPKDNFGEARDTALGTNSGKGEVETASGAGQQYRQADQMLTSIDGILKDGSLDWATGFGGGALSSIPGTPMRAVRAKIDQLGGQAFLQAFESLRGGGQITEVEGIKATQAIGRLDTAQSPDDYRNALGDLREIVMQARDRAERQMQNPPRTSQGQPIRPATTPDPSSSDPLGLR